MYKPVLKNSVASGNCYMMQGAHVQRYDNLEGQDGVGWRFKTEGTYVYLCLIHVAIWQKPTQYFKVIILQLKIN